jgi:uncharacterized protein YndB with AHSA1/START domain
MTTKDETLQITTPSDVEVVLTRVFDAPRRLVWKAFTTPELASRWLLGPDGWTMPVCEMDVRPGGSWHYVWRKNDGSEMEMRGSYREVDPPSRLVNTEKWGPEWPETVNTLTLEEEGGRTTMRQSIRYVSREARDAALKTGMKDGAQTSYDRLAEQLRTMGRG